MLGKLTPDTHGALQGRSVEAAMLSLDATFKHNFHPHELGFFQTLRRRGP